MKSCESSYSVICTRIGSFQHFIVSDVTTCICACHRTQRSGWNLFVGPLAEHRQRALRRRGSLAPSCLRRGRLRRPRPQRCQLAVATRGRTSRPASMRTITSWSPPPLPPPPWLRPPSEIGEMLSTVRRNYSPQTRGKRLIAFCGNLMSIAYSDT